MQVVYVPNNPPEKFSKALFLAGPSPRSPEQSNWRPEAIKILETLGYDGMVFCPVPEVPNNYSHDYDQQVGWELKHINMADQVVFWVPRSGELPGLTTNVEFGMVFDSGKAVLGYPESATSMRYLAHHAAQESVPIHNTLERTLREALERLGEGQERSGGEREVPLHIWRLPHFQAWYRAQKQAGNRLDGAKLLWNFRVGKNRSLVFAYALQVDVFVAAESRNKANEFIISRPDIAAVVAFHRQEYVLDTEVVLIKEFRSPGRTQDGVIHEVPGGSSWNPEDNYLTIAAHELLEETGFYVEPCRLRRLGSRQLSGTLSTHQAHVFSCELTAGEMARLRAEEAAELPFGNSQDTERTYVEVRRLGDLLRSDSNLVDWSTLGMILTATAT